MKFLIIFFLITFAIGDTSKKPRIIYSESKYCKTCHAVQVADWNTTWHSRSYTGNILFNKMVDYISKKSRKDKKILLMECAECHSPRITKTSVDSYRIYKMTKAYGLETKETKEIDNALKDKHLKEGINCIVCHNIDQIKRTRSSYDRGHNLIKWTKPGVMTGPFNSKSTAYHTNQKRDFFRKDANDLCLICHYSGVNANGVVINETGKEYEKTDKSMKCVECHMSIHKDEYVAKHVSYTRKEIKLRKTRSHIFAGVRNSDIVKKAIELKVSTSLDDKLKITMKNKTYHKFPTGFGGREVVVEARFRTQQGTIIKKTKINASYYDNMGRETVSYLAHKVKEDKRLKPLESREFLYHIPKGTQSVTVTVWYKLVKDKLKRLLKISDPVFGKKYKIIEYSIDL